MTQLQENGGVEMISVPADAYFDLCREVAELRYKETTLRAALKAIDGPCDWSPWVDWYREAGGGYDGLQAIARETLSRV